MRMLLIIGTISIGQILYAQNTIESLKEVSRKIKNIPVQADEFEGLNEYRQDIQQKQEIGSILLLDVFNYFRLEGYDSELKKKVYTETDDYKSKLSELKQAKTELLKSQYFIDYSIENYEKRKFKYNLANQTFTFTNATFGTLSIPEGLLTLGTIMVDKPQGFQIKNAPARVNGVVAVKQTISMKVSDERVALKIEDNANDLKILILFRFTGIKSFKNYVFENFVSKDYYLLTKLNKIILYNSVTGEVYKEYKYVLPTVKK